jgi:hypothetical protein
LQGNAERKANILCLWIIRINKGILTWENP